MTKQIECVMIVLGNSVNVNTFDATFRSLPPPQWPGKKPNLLPCYTLNSFYPVPEEILRRGYKAAGRLWCERHWGSADDLKLKTVRRYVSSRSYRFTVPVNPPVEAILCASQNYPAVAIHLQYIDTEPSDLFSSDVNSVVVRHHIQNGKNMTSQSPNRANIKIIPDEGLHGLFL